MFGWLTRNDGRRGAQAARRLASPRASVFSEFALVMPIVMLVCSALIEITGYWDAQVMANHAAWTTGRIAMVRGSDGLPFWSALNEKSKTGVTSTNMPASIQKFIEDLTEGLQAANKFNNRGGIATLFLMSTCGIGYYGGTPKTDLTKAFNKIIDDGVSAIVDGIPEMLTEAITNFELPDFFPWGGGGILDIIKEKINEFVQTLFKALFGPFLEKIAEKLKEVADRLLGQLGDFISGDRFARQLYGGMSRIVRANATTGKEVLTVVDMTNTYNNPFFFSKIYGGRLVYPQVADKEVKSDGYLVTGAHGWPPNDQEFTMTHVEVNWPYEYGWLFPVVSGGTGTSNGPVATGHSMVFPQPSIMNDNLYSAGAKPYEDGSTTNNPFAPLDELADEMRAYLRAVRFSMRYRIGVDKLTLKDTDTTQWQTVSGSLKYCEELAEAFSVDVDDLIHGKDAPRHAPVEGDYAECWKRVTGGQKQNAYLRDLESYFSPDKYHSLEYFYWDGSLHNRYGKSIVDAKGTTDFDGWYGRNPGLRYGASGNVYDTDQGTFKKWYNWCLNNDSWMTGKDKERLEKVKPEELYSNLVSFARSGKVNVPNFVKWQGEDVGAWTTADRNLRTDALNTEQIFADITVFVTKEITEISGILEGGGTWTGSTNDPVFDPNDPVTDPKAAADRAREKWEELKQSLRAKLKEVDAAAVQLRDQWAAYKSDVDNFRAGRANSVGQYFTVAFIRTAARTGTFKPSSSSYRFAPEAVMNGYSVVNGTREMQRSVQAYQYALANAMRLEKEYGETLGLESANPNSRQVGKEAWEFLESVENVRSDPPGNMTPGSDTGSIIDYEHQTYKDGVWQWDK